MIPDAPPLTTHSLYPQRRARLVTLLALALAATSAWAMGGSGLAFAGPGEPPTAADDTTHVDSLATAPRGEAAPPTLPTTPATALVAPNSTARSSGDAKRGKPTYPGVEIAVGISRYFTGSNGVAQAFHQIEDVHRAVGFSIRPAADVTSWGLVLSTLRVRLPPPIAVACQLGRTLGTSNDVRLTGGIVSGRLALRSLPGVSLEAGLGGGVCGFDFTRHYDALISPPGSTYTVLDRITLKGRRGYWTANGGVTFDVAPHYALEALVQYVGMRDMKTDAGQAGRVSINLSGGFAGVGLIYE
jgi:hypothetical protein